MPAGLTHLCLTYSRTNTASARSLAPAVYGAQLMLFLIRRLSNIRSHGSACLSFYDKARTHVCVCAYERESVRACERECARVRESACECERECV